MYELLFTVPAWSYNFYDILTKLDENLFWLVKRIVKIRNSRLGICESMWWAALIFFKRFCLALTLFPKFFCLVLKNYSIIGRESHRQNLILINCIWSVLKKLNSFLETFYSGPRELTEWKSWIMFCPLFRLIIFRQYIFVTLLSDDLLMTV